MPRCRRSRRTLTPKNGRGHCTAHEYGWATFVAAWCGHYASVVGQHYPAPHHLGPCGAISDQGEGHAHRGAAMDYGVGGRWLHVRPAKDPEGQTPLIHPRVEAMRIGIWEVGPAIVTEHVAH